MIFVVVSSASSLLVLPFWKGLTAANVVHHRRIYSYRLIMQAFYLLCQGMNFFIKLFLHSLLFSIYEIHYHLNKDVHLVHPAFGNHQGQCDKGSVSDSFCAIWTVEDAVILQEP